MDGYLITFRSVTPAQRGEQILEAGGIRCTLQRTPKKLSDRGCGYSLYVPQGSLRQALGLLKDHQVAYRKAYRLGDGELREVQI